MTDLESKILPYYFIILTIFITINMVMNLSLYSFTKIKNIKLLFWYWLSLLLTFAFQGQFQYGDMPIILSYASNIVPTTIISVIIFDTMSKKAPIKLYSILWLVAFSSTPLLHYLGCNFITTSIPLSLAMGFIPLHTAYHLLEKNQHLPTTLEKLMSVIMVITFIHFLNFSFFRMGEGNQLWGHAVSFALYQIFSVSIFALVLECRSRHEKDRLSELVDIQTIELKKNLRVKETLFHIVLHDIATPIQGLMLTIQLLQKKKEFNEVLVNKASEMVQLIRNIVDQVKSIEAVGSGKFNIEPSPVKFENCLKDIQTIFDAELKKKNLQLKINNQLSSGIRFNADQNVFTMSILGNLVSNAIKFSRENSPLCLNSYERGNKVIIELVDKGVGIPKELISAMFDPVKRSNRSGTNGEKGTGFGMIQVKSYLNHFGGQIDVDSRPMEMFPLDHGTKITLTMDKFLSSVH